MTIRKSILFGNGLGMALDPEFFLLEKAFRTVWNKGGDYTLDYINKQLLLKCIGSTSDSPPKSESELLSLHSFLRSFSDLKSYETNDLKILLDNVRDFDVAVKRYFTMVSMYFHNHNVEIPEIFKENFEKFVRKYRCHIATLNYDDLIYKIIIDRNLHEDLNGRAYGLNFTLVQGNPTIFNEENLSRKFNSNHSWFMHLHGSPLYVENGGATQKLSTQWVNEALLQDSEMIGKHIVLQHFDAKVEVITQSKLLASYWKYFFKALNESDEIVLFGYSGQDKHLNEVINLFIEKKSLKVKIVEWSGAENSKDYWKNIFEKLDKDSLKLIQLDNIMEYNWEESNLGTEYE